jgi:hypothetical protein
LEIVSSFLRSIVQNYDRFGAFGIYEVEESSFTALLYTQAPTQRPRQFETHPRKSHLAHGKIPSRWSSLRAVTLKRRLPRPHIDRLSDIGERRSRRIIVGRTAPRVRFIPLVGGAE